MRAVAMIGGSSTSLLIGLPQPPLPPCNAREANRSCAPAPGLPPAVAGT